ncbi:hypothetical protein PR048_004032 [Dryococelus australis]|uniref:YqaJ viral recombinase domain-containing protein n=1 Tax=Dryococelus australis TaxID=614101 RepID=A0ABQ9I5H5_9NEOP|nr:hypothetical protein PR048_004032 [Dryococelus australis]
MSRKSVFFYGVYCRNGWPASGAATMARPPADRAQPPSRLAGVHPFSVASSACSDRLCARSSFVVSQWSIMEIQDNLRRGKETQLRQNARRIKNETIKGRNHKRSKRVTASIFGVICGLRPTTSREKAVTSLLYGDFSGCAATKCGIANEPFVIEPAGVFVDPVLPLLAVTPGSLVSKGALVEAKYPVTARNLTPQEAVKEKKWTYCILKDNHLHLKENHPYRHTKIIHFGRKKLRNPLTNFFMGCLLPEIIDPCYTRGRPEFIPISLELSELRPSDVGSYD